MYKWIKKPPITILLVSIAVMMPQILGHQLILGGVTTVQGDALFHFNRIYDAMMQLKTLHFHYFVSDFGFNQSARVINAVYGPFSSYIYGAVLLVTGSWWLFQIISSIGILYLGGLTFFYLARQVELDRGLALVGSLIYLNTEAITSWATAQKGAALAAAILPLVILAAVKMIQQKEHALPIWLLAIGLSLLVQIHNLTAIMAVMMLIPFWLLGLIRQQQRWLFVKHTLLAALIFMVLTANVWATLLDLTLHNRLMNPVNFVLASYTTMPSISSHWLGIPILILVMWQLYQLIFRWRLLSLTNRVVALVGLFFVFLSSELMPWQLIQDNLPILGSLLQFPARFMIIATPLILLGSLQTVQTDLQVPRHWRQTGSIVVLVLLFVGNLQTVTSETQQWSTNFATASSVQKHGTMQQIRQAWLSPQLAAGLQRLTKDTSDYLPKMGKTADAYHLVNHSIYTGTTTFHKRVTRQGLQVDWNAPQATPIQVPVVKYQQTHLKLNGQTIQPLHQNAVGVITVQSHQGLNQLLVTYQPARWVSISLVVAMVSWIIVGVEIIRRKCEHHQPR